jgi:LTXXQ motif family protein
MRKALIPMLASLALCGAGTAALLASNGGALANPRKPFMVALLGATDQLAQNLPETAPAAEMGTPPSFGLDMKQMCDDRYASEVGRMAYLEARLHLTDAEQPLFTHWKEVRVDIAKHRTAECAAHAGPGQDHADPVAQMGREEDMLKQRIADLEAERPVFSALYAVLAPDQRLTLAPPHPMMGHDRGPMNRGPMNQGPMDHGPMPPNGMGEMPPPPPPAP